VRRELQVRERVGAPEILDRVVLDDEAPVSRRSEFSLTPHGLKSTPLKSHNLKLSNSHSIPNSAEKE